MRGAMARFLTVNGFSGRPPVPRGNHDLNSDPESNAAPEFGVEPTSYGVEPTDYGVESNPTGSEPTSYGVSSTRYGVASAARKNSNDQGPCLYFGPQGQRCDRPAIASNFCARHLLSHLNQSARFASTSPAQTAGASPSSEPYTGVASANSKPYSGIPSPGFKHYRGLPSPGSKPFARIIAVGIAIFAALWPVIADLLREIIRWIHAH
jgi:hypothetical protein